MRIPLIGGAGGRGTTIAGLLVAGVLLGLFLNTIADILSYGVATSINATSLFHRVALNTTEGHEPETYVGRTGNYTYVVSKPETSGLRSFVDFILYLLPALARVLGNPGALAIILGVTLIMIAYEVEAR